MEGSGGGFLEKIVEWVILGVLAVGGWLFRGLHSRITELEKHSVQKSDFRHFEERADQSRGELRESIIKLYDRMDELKSLILEHRRDRDR